MRRLIAKFRNPRGATLKALDESQAALRKTRECVISERVARAFAEAEAADTLREDRVIGSLRRQS